MFVSVYIVYAIIIFMCTLIYFDDIAVTPKEIYETNNMNMFGCTIIWIICFVFDPLFFIAHFIYWICHVGRKD